MWQSKPTGKLKRRWPKSLDHYRMRLVLGGSSRFSESQLKSVTGSLLYSDTILVPDPIMPWLERERSEEKFQRVLVLKTAHSLLQLKPVVDADLPYPALVVFPSWEKILEENDEQTKLGIQQLFTDVVAWGTGENLSSFEEILDYSDTHTNKFLKSVEKSNLFVSPGGDVSSSLRRSLSEYEEHLKQWRSPDWLEQYSRLPPARRVLNGLFERIGPIYHMIENAQEFSGHPLMCIEQQAHYFQLVCRASSDRLIGLEHLSRETSSLVAALGSRRLEWLTGIDLGSIINLRRDNENEAFRQRMALALNRLSEAEFSEVDRVAAEVCREIEGAIAEHERDMRIVQDRYNRTHGQTSLIALGGLGAALMPSLSPLLGPVVPLAVAIKYGHDKLAEVQEKKHLARSYAGVLVSAER